MIQSVAPNPPKLLDQLRDKIRVKHCGISLSKIKWITPDEFFIAISGQ